MVPLKPQPNKKSTLKKLQLHRSNYVFSEPKMFTTPKDKEFKVENIIPQLKLIPVKVKKRKNDAHDSHTINNSRILAS